MKVFTKKMNNNINTNITNNNKIYLNYYYHNNNTDNCLFTMFAVSAIKPHYHGLQ